MPLCFMILKDMIFAAKNILKALKNIICATAAFDMQYLEAEIWTMVEFMRTLFVSSFFAVDTMFMSESSIKRKSTKVFTTFPGKYVKITLSYDRSVHP